jgi:DNA-binding transcriptional MocR family regulator
MHNFCKFAAVLERLDDTLDGLGIATWTRPKGGYFILFNTLLALPNVGPARAAGVTLTPAGAHVFNGADPNDSNIRIAPTFPTLPTSKRPPTCLRCAWNSRRGDPRIASQMIVWSIH